MRVLFFIMVLMFALPVYAQNFFDGLPDVPLMQGLVEIEDQALSFDKPEGRILMAYAEIDDSVDVQSLQSYYESALPAFGWSATSPLSYRRMDENLNLLIITHADGSRVLEITISPL